MITAAFTMAVLSIIKDGIFQNPAQRMASEIDAESEVELQFMQTFGWISTPALLARYQLIEEQLASREKWLSVARWLGVISAAFIVLSGELGLSVNISSWIKICMSALLAGFAVGAILVLSGSAELKRLSIILKKMGERRQADDVRRKRKRGK